MPSPDRDLENLVRGFLNHLSVERGRSQNTIAAYRRDLARYTQYLVEQSIPFDQITESVIDQFIVTVRTATAERRALAPSSTARLLASIRGLHSFAVAEGSAPSNPVQDLRPPKAAQRLPKALTIAEVDLLLNAPDLETSQGLRDKALLEFLYSTGARVSEAISLDLDDLDLENFDAVDQAGIPQPNAYPSARVLGKGSKERIIPVGSFAAQALRDYLVRVRPQYAAAGKGTPALFLNSLGRRLSRQSAWTIIRTNAHLAELPSAQMISPHTLRHCFATHLLNGGADVRVVQELLGHASVTTTQLYTHVTIDGLREVYLTTHPRART